MFFIVVVAVCLYCATIGVLSALIALGQSHWGSRLAMLFAVSLISTCFVQLFSFRSEIMIGTIVGGSCLAYFLAFPSNAAAIPVGAIGALFLLGTAAMIPWGRFDPDEVARGFALAGLTSGVLLGMRATGFRLVRMIPSGWANEVFLGTGRELDEWCQWLDDHHCQNLPRPELAKQLQNDGVEFIWADWIATMYFGYLAKAPPQWIRSAVQANPVGLVPREGFGRDCKATQYSLSQMFVWVTVVAIVIAALRAFSKEFPTDVDLAYGLPLACMLSLCVITSLFAVLSLPRSRGGWLIWLGMTTAVAFSAGKWLHLQGVSLTGMIPVSGVAVVVLAVSTASGFAMMRSLGFRLLRL